LAANGNEANNSWHYLLTPADNTKVFSVGAVQENGQSSSFSSFGPNASGAIKPDASARGTSAATVFENTVTSVSGTSIATPIAAGGVACLLQALPADKNRESIRSLLRNTASLAPSHTDQMGFGILNFGKALSTSLGLDDTIVTNGFNLYPVPSSGDFFIDSKGNAHFQIFEMSGRRIHSGTITKGKNEIKTQLKPGVYTIRLQNDDQKITSKKLIIK